MTRRRFRSLSLALLTTLLVFGLGGLARADVPEAGRSADAGDLATAQAAIDSLTASLPGLVPVTGGGQVADVPECDVARTADALAIEAGGLLQSYGGEAGGGSGQIAVFDSKKLAKRFFKLVTSDDDEVCSVATAEVGLTPFSGGASATADLSRGKLRGVRGSVTLVGTITLGALEILQTDAVVRRGPVVIRGNMGEFATAGAGLDAIITDWVKSTAKQF